MGVTTTQQLLTLLSPERRRCAVMAALMTASVLGEVAVPYFMGHVTDWVASEDEVAAAWSMAVLGLSSAVTEFACDVTYTGTLSRVLGRLQRRVFAAVLRWDVTSLQAMGTGAVTARVTGDVEATHAAVAEVLIILLWYLARSVFLLVAMAWLSPRLAFVTLLSLPVLLLLPRGISKIQQGLSRQVQEGLAGATKVAVETFQAMTTVRSFAHEAGAAERYHQRLRRVYRLERKGAAIYAATVWASGFSALALKLGLLCYGAQLVAKGTITTGDLVTFLIYQMQFTEALKVLLQYYSNMAKAVGSSEKIFEFLDQERQVAPTEEPEPNIVRGHLQLEDVWFSYPEHQEPILKGVSLELRPGEVVAVVAPPGAGKSTLVSLVLCLRPPGAGRVLLDGHPLPACQHPYQRCQVAVVPQEPVLFSHSLRGEWSRAQVTVAAHQTGAHTFITRLPLGYDTGRSCAPLLDVPVSPRSLVLVSPRSLAPGFPRPPVLVCPWSLVPWVLGPHVPYVPTPGGSPPTMPPAAGGAGDLRSRKGRARGAAGDRAGGPGRAGAAGGRAGGGTTARAGVPQGAPAPRQPLLVPAAGRGTRGDSGGRGHGEGGGRTAGAGDGTADARMGTPRDGDSGSQDRDTGDRDRDTTNQDRDNESRDGDGKNCDKRP
ncbi:antigen peptide transporter 1 isoform 2-T2 [Morphnus guianensis]